MAPPKGCSGAVIAAWSPIFWLRGHALDDVRFNILAAFKQQYATLKDNDAGDEARSLALRSAFPQRPATLLPERIGQAASCFLDVFPNPGACVAMENKATLGA
jgi:hypothetical protein